MTDKSTARKHWLLFDWGDTLMRDNPSEGGPMATWKHVEAVPGAVEVLNILKPEWGLALATNAVASDEDQIQAALKRVGLDVLIERIYCYRVIGYKKPDPKFFTYILNDLGATVDQVLMVGDSYGIDVAGANQVGIQAIWLNEHSDEIRVGALHRTIRCLIELPCALAELVAQNKLNR